MCRQHDPQLHGGLAVEDVAQKVVAEEKGVLAGDGAEEVDEKEEEGVSSCSSIDCVIYEGRQ